MAQYSLNAYDADVYIPEFKGLMQYGDQMGTDLRYSPDCMDMETTSGVLQPVPAMGGAVIANQSSGTDKYIASMDCTIMYVREKVPPASTQEVFVSHGTRTVNGGEYDTYVIAKNDKLYVFHTLGDLVQDYGYNMSHIDYELTALSGTYHSNRWSWCTYEITETVSNTSFTHNVLLLSNGTDGLYMYANNQITKVASGYANSFSFSSIERYAERIWGCAGDTIYYSRPYAPNDWTEPGANEQPEDGAGSIRFATFDNDHITSLVHFGDSLIAFSTKRAWRITGSDPSTFYAQEQYGNGSKYPDTIAVMRDRIIMLGENSLVTYDGTTVYPFMKEATYEILKNIAHNKDIKPVGMVIGDKYVLALSNELFAYGASYYEDLRVEDGEQVITDTKAYYKSSTGYRMLIYDETDGTITVRSTPYISSMCKGTPYAIVFDMYTDFSDPTALIPQRKPYNAVSMIRFNSWETEQISNTLPTWTTPWITLGRKDIQKGGFDLYFTPELKKNKYDQRMLWPREQLTPNASGYVTDADWDEPAREFNDEAVEASAYFMFRIQTEKKTKTKYVTIPYSKSGRQKRIHFGGAGRRFRIIIQENSGACPWRLIGGIHIIAEIDKD